MQTSMLYMVLSKDPTEIKKKPLDDLHFCKYLTQLYYNNHVSDIFIYEALLLKSPSENIIKR